MRDYHLATTANRSVVGIMNEFSRLAEAHRDRDPCPDLTVLAQRLATTPCSPLYGRNVGPDRTGRTPAHRYVHPQVLLPPTLTAVR
jgi:hypothetical protein